MQTKTPSIVEMVDSAIPGRWLEIAENLYMSDLIKKAFDNPGRSRSFCPNHQGESGEAFRFYPDASEKGGCVCNTCGSFVGLKMLSFISGKDIKEVFKDVVSYLGLSKDKSHVIKPVQHKPKVVEVKPRQWALDNLISTRSRCIELTHPKAEPGRLYFLNRGLEISNLSSDVMFDPSHPYYDRRFKKVTKHVPAIISVLRNSEGEAVTFHRIYIDYKGKKAFGADSKKLMPSVIEGAIGKSNCSIHVSNGSTKSIAVTEGIEDANAVNLVTGVMTFATYSSSLMERFIPPVDTEHVHIYGDFNVGGAGQTSSAKLAANLINMGFKVTVHLPIHKKHPLSLTVWEERDETSKSKLILEEQGYKVVSGVEVKKQYADLKGKEPDWNDLFQANRKHPLFFE